MYNATIRICSPGIVTTTIIFKPEQIIILPLDNLSGPPIYIGMPEKTTQIIESLFEWEIFPINKFTIATYSNHLQR